MLARSWRGATTAENAQNYVGYLEATGFRAFADTPGSLGAIGLRRIRDGKAEFLLVSLWEGTGAVRRFAGPHPERAVFFPEDDRFLIERDEHVDHFEVVYADVRPPSLLRRVWRRWLSWSAEMVRDAGAEGWKLAAFR